MSSSVPLTTRLLIHELTVPGLEVLPLERRRDGRDLKEASLIYFNEDPVASAAVELDCCRLILVLLALMKGKQTSVNRMKKGGGEELQDDEQIYQVLQSAEAPGQMAAAASLRKEMR